MKKIKKRKLKIKKSVLRKIGMLIIIIVLLLLIVKGCAKEKYDTLCFDNILGSYISSEVTTLKEIDITDILEKNKRGIKYSKVMITDNHNIYVVIKTKKDKVLGELDSYFKKNYEGYTKKELEDNYYVYIYNGYKNINLDELNTCVFEK